MAGRTGFVERYLAVWNEPDAGLRREAVTGIWSEKGMYANTGKEFHGHDEIEAAVREAYEDFVAKGFAFRLGGFAENHSAARLTWEMVPAGGGDVVARGTQYLIFDENGLVLTDHQFPEEV